MANPFSRFFGMGPMGNWPGTPGINPNAPMPGVMTGPGGFGGFGGPIAPPQPPQPPPRFAGPPWLQKIAGGMQRFNTGLQNPMTAALLQAAAPKPKGTSSPFADLGFAAQQGQQGLMAQQEHEMRRKLIEHQMQPKPSPQDEILARMAALGYSLDQKGYQQYNADQAKPSTTINVGESELDKPIAIAQLDTVRLPDGTTPPLGTTMRQAREMGAKVLSAEDQKRTQQADQALGILNQLEELAIGPDGVFNEVEAGLANRAAAAIDFGLDMLTQNDPRASQFHDMSQATLAPFIKFLGETGSLAQGDVQRAIGLLPRTFPLPDTGRVARDKIAELREIITRGVNKMNSVTRQSENVPPPPPGFTLDPE